MLTRGPIIAPTARRWFDAAGRPSPERLETSTGVAEDYSDVETLITDPTQGPLVKRTPVFAPGEIVIVPVRVLGLPAFDAPVNIDTIKAPGAEMSCKGPITALDEGKLPVFYRSVAG